MKRRLSTGPSTGPKRRSRQDPVSCESCRRKKLKCDRNRPCSSCASRGLSCAYGQDSVPSPVVKANTQSEERSAPADIPLQPPVPATAGPTLPLSTSPNHTRNFDPIRTADSLETIMMGHRVPSAVPATLRDGLAPHQHIEMPETHRSSLSKSLLALTRAGILASRESLVKINLPSLLPPESEALGLLAYYHEHLDYQYHLIVFSRTERDVRALYQNLANDQPVSLSHLALLLSIMSAALFYQLLATDTSDLAELCSGETAFLAGAALIQANHTSYPTMEGLQAAMILSHHLSSLTLHSSISALFTHGSLVGQAKALGLHTLDKVVHAEERKIHGFDKTELELKRRLWWDIVSYDWLISFLSGPQEWTYNITPSQMNVLKPLNIEDEDIETNELGVPLSTPTRMSYTLARLQLAQVCREIVDQMAPEYHLGLDVPYEKVLELDRKLHDAHNALPAFFRYDQNSRREFSELYRQRPAFAWQRAFIQQGYHARLCRLHRQYFIRGAKDPRFSYSHVVSLRAARKVLEVKRIMDEEDPLLTPNSSFFWAVMHHVFMAAVILLIDVCFNWDDILADKRKEEVLDACRTLSRAQQTSSVAREGINAMMDILCKHWKQRKRPSSQSGSNSDIREAQALAYPHVPPVNYRPMMPGPVPMTVRTANPAVASRPFPLPAHQTLDNGGAGAPEVSIEETWSEWLDERAMAALDTPDWMNMLTDLTSTTMPCE